MEGQYKQQVKIKLDAFVHEIFALAKNFPREELYVTVAQLKRAALSIVLNYIEGYARLKKGNQLQFLEIAYGSLKETKYLLYFSVHENFIDSARYNHAFKMIDELGAMLWTEISALIKTLE